MKGRNDNNFAHKVENGYLQAIQEFYYTKNYLLNAYSIMWKTQELKRKEKVF